MPANSTSKFSEGQVMQVRYSGETIHFRVVPKNAKRHSVTIKVDPSGSVTAHSPKDATKEEIQKAVAKRARWIHKQRRHFLELQNGVRERKFVSGESHFYLGRRYLLKVLANSGQESEVKLLRGRLEVTVSDKSIVAEALAAWYRERSQIVFPARLSAMTEQALWVKKQPPLRIRKMSKQWGNCSPNGTLTLNVALVKAPRDCIDYVLLHELAHHAEHNHSKRFYRLMDRVMPTWRRTKMRLDALAPALLNGVGNSEV